jgi:tetratricopeptide (TPR) repeat protein
MLAGEVPFPGDSSGKGLLSARSMPRLEVPEAPGLGDLATRMLARDPVDRPRDGAEVLASLEAIQEQVRASTPGRTPSSSTGPSARMRRSHPFRWAVLGAVAVLALGGAIAAYVHLRDGPVAGRTLVAVADMQNGTGDPELDGLSGLLVTSLEQSRRIGVMTRGRMMDLARSAGHEKVERIDEAVGRDIGRKAGATALLVANVHRLGTTYAVEVRAIDPRRDTYIFTLRDQSPSKEGIIPLIDRMSDQVRREFQEPGVEVASRRVRLEDVVTANLDAYRHYFLARSLVERIRLPEAVVELERALAIDPRFALAHYQLARLGSTGEIGEARRKSHEEEALRLVDRLPARERGMLLATSAAAAGRMEEAESIYRGLARDFPDDTDVLLGLGELLLDREQAGEAAPFLARAVEIDPTNEYGQICLCRALGFLGRTDELVAAARGALSAAPGPETELFLAEASLWSGDLSTATAAARRAISIGERQAIDTLVRAGLRGGDEDAVRDGLASAPSLGASVALFGGRVKDAREALDRSPPVAGAWAAQDALEKVLVRVGTGDRSEVRLAAERLVATGSRATGPAASAVAWAGERESAERLAGLLSTSSRDAALYRAVALRRDARPDEALPALRDLARTHVSGSTFLDSFFLGEAALAAGRPDEAVSALRRFQRMNLPTYTLAWAYPRSLLLLARAEEAAGRLPEAREAANLLARTWRDADPDFPPLAELAEVQARLAR